MGTLEATVCVGVLVYMEKMNYSLCTAVLPCHGSPLSSLCTRTLEKQWILDWLDSLLFPVVDSHFLGFQGAPNQ